MHEIPWCRFIRALVVGGMRQKAIAEQVGCSPATVSRWHRGIAQPEQRHHAALRKVFEDNVTKLNPEVIAEVATSEDMLVLLDGHDRVVQISAGMKAVMRDVGIAGWDTSKTEDGMMRIIRIRRVT